MDTAGELRSDSRSLVFEAGGMVLVTMRPSDVPTYVEAGAADLGITGKDVLMEQSDRAFYELLDLGYGACRMVVAAPAGDEHVAEHERRLGAVRIATKYPRIAERFFEETGRAGRGDRGQGVGRARADLGARRRDRRPRRHRAHAAGERARGARGDRALDRAPDLEPGRPQAARAEIDELAARLRGGDVVRVARVRWDGRDPAEIVDGVRAAAPPPPGLVSGWPRSSSASASAATRP